MEEWIYEDMSTEKLPEYELSPFPKPPHRIDAEHVERRFLLFWLNHQMYFMNHGQIKTFTIVILRWVSLELQCWFSNQDKKCIEKRRLNHSRIGLRASRISSIYLFLHSKHSNRTVINDWNNCKIWLKFQQNYWILL